jgi:hypothetical protein
MRCCAGQLGPIVLLVGSVVVTSSSVAHAAHADLSDWTGNGNTTPPNSYVVIPPSSAGGTFRARMTPAAPAGTFTPAYYLSDSTLTDGPLGFDDSLSMFGTMTFSNSNNTDPSWFFGWYSSTDYRSRLGISAAQALQFPTIPADAFRMQVAWGSGEPAVTALTTRPITYDNSNLSSRATIPGGTYDFTFEYTPGNLTVHIDPNGTDWRRVDLPVPQTTPDVFDRFGFLQVETAVGPTPLMDVATFQMVMSDFHYTGNSTVPEPSTSLLAGVCLLGLRAGRRRSRKVRGATA